MLREMRGDGGSRVSPKPYRSCSLTNSVNTNTTSSLAIVLITVFYKVTLLTEVIDVLSNDSLGCIYSCNASWMEQEEATLVSRG